MGKKRLSALGSEDEASSKAKKAVKLEQKKIREHKTVAPKISDESSVVTESVTETKAKKATRIRGKAYQTAKKAIDSEKTYALKDALDLLRKTNLTSFDPTVELHLTLKSKISAKEIELPHTTGKSKKVAVADDETVAKITKGIIDFDILVATPAQMASLVKFAKVLGPRGLMPNPKTGTVTAKPEETVKKLSSSSVLTLKTEKDVPVIHTIVGKLSAKDSALSANISAIMTALSGQLVKVVLKSTMSPAIKIQI